MSSMLKEQAYATLLERMLTGQYAPGDHLDRRSVAKELGMSVAPVHEAMLQLEHEELLEAIPRRGTRVRSISREDVWSHLVVREALECQAARMICGLPVEQALDSLLPLAEAADARAADDVEHSAREVKLHCALVDLAACPALARHYRQAMHVSLFYRISLLLPSPSEGLHDRHVDYLQRLSCRDPRQAEEAARHHVWSGKPEWVRRQRYDRLNQSAPGEEGDD